MPQVSLDARDTAGGTLRAAGQSIVRCDGALVIVLGDPVDPHGTGAHASAIMAEGNPTVKIEGKEVVRAGHVATCGDACTGSASLIVG